MRAEHEDQDTRQGMIVITRGFPVSSLEESQWGVRAGRAEGGDAGGWGIALLLEALGREGMGSREMVGYGEQRDGWVWGAERWLGMGSRKMVGKRQNMVEGRVAGLGQPMEA